MMPTILPPLKAPAELFAGTKGAGERTAILFHQVLIKPSAMAMPTCPTPALSIMNVLAVSVDHPLLDLHFTKPSHDYVCVCVCVLTHTHMNIYIYILFITNKIKLNHLSKTLFCREINF